jgi:CheY-like chemotaxis protein
MTELKTILMIDDDRDYVCAIETLLESAGYRVKSAPNGREGLQLARTLQPDLILLDVMMTERTEGFFTLQEIRRVPSLKETPVMVISSIYADQPIFRVSPEAGWLPANLFLPKPVESVRLLAEIRRLIDSAATPVGQTQSGRRDL